MRRQGLNLRPAEGADDVMLRAVADMIRWQRGGNTHLGTIILFTPLAVSAGMCMAEKELNPGSTADLVATALFLAILIGLKP